jgi:hypothetical protein
VIEATDHNSTLEAAADAAPYTTTPRAGTSRYATDVTAGRHNATLDQPLAPALLAAEAWARGVVEPLTRTIAEQQQLVNQAEMIRQLRAELAALTAAHAAFTAPRQPVDAPTAPESPDPTTGGAISTLVAMPARVGGGRPGRRGGWVGELPACGDGQRRRPELETAGCGRRLL